MGTAYERFAHENEGDIFSEQNSWDFSILLYVYLRSNKQTNKQIWIKINAAL